MAKIVLNVGLNSAPAVQSLKTIETTINSIAASLGKIKPNTALTAQINALTKNYKALGDVVVRNAKAEVELAKAREHDAKAGISNAKATVELAKARKIDQQGMDSHSKTRAKIIKDSLESSAKQARLDAESEAKVKKLTETKKEATAQTEKQTKAVNKGTTANERHQQSILSMALGFLKWQIAATLIMQPLVKLKGMLDSINDTLVKTEDAVIALQRVLPSGSASDGEISGALYDLGIKYGQTFENVSQIATNFARTGMEWQDTVKATEAALLALNVAELDATEASDGLIAIMTQFNIDASELEGTIDKLNKTADRFPVTTEKLLAALQRTGSAAVNANLSLDETIGLITSLSKATGRSGQNLGTALNSLIQYSTKDKSLGTFASLSSETEKVVEQYKSGAATILDVWTEVSKVIQNANAQQESILSELANSEDIQDLSEELHDELGDIFETTQDVYGVANTFRKNYFIALLDNIDTVIAAQKVAENALGYSQKENEQAMETYTRKVTALKTEWEKLANGEQGILSLKKFFVEVGSAILDFIDRIGGLKTVFLELIGLTLTWVGIFKGKAIFTSIIAGFTRLTGVLSNASFAWEAYAAGAATAGEAMKMSLPVIGLVITSLTLLANAIVAANNKVSAFDETYEKYMSDIEGSNESKAREEAEIKYLDTLIDRYDELNNQEELSLGEKAELSKIVRELSGVYTSLNFALDETTGKYSVMTEEIKKTREEMVKLIEAEYLEQQGKDAFATMQKILSDNEVSDYLQLVGKKWDYYREHQSLIDSYHANKNSPIEHVFNWFNDGDEYADTYDKLKASVEAYEEAEKIYNEWLEAVTNGSGDLADSIEKQGKGTEAVEENYEGIIEKLKEYKDELKDSNTLLDKQNAVLEAQKDYEEAIAAAREKYAEEVAKARKELMLDALDNFSKGLEYEEKLEEKLQKVEEERLKLNEEIAKAKTDYLKNVLEQYVDKLEEEASLEEKILAVEEARRKLEEARGQRNVKAYNSNTKTWEWQANEKNIASAEEDLADKQQALNEYLENEAFKEINSYLGDGGYSISEVQKILDKWLSKGSGGELNTWGKGLMSIVTDSIRNNKYDDTDVQDKVDGVTDAVDALNEYLKDTAVKEIKELINGGNFSMSDIQAIIDKWGARTESGSLGAWEQNLMSALGAAASQAVSVEFDTSGIDSALEKLNSAQTGLQDFLAEQLLSEYIELFENGTVSNATAKRLLNKYKELGVSEDILDDVVRMIEGSTGIRFRDSYNPNYVTQGTKNKWGNDLSSSWHYYEDGRKYDNGGILQGMGVKATNRDEAVINPALTSRLMSPVFNRKFFNFSQGLSNLADYVDRIPDGNGVVYRNQSSSVDDHRSYSVNGVPISADVAERNTLADIFRMAAFKKN